MDFSLPEDVKMVQTLVGDFVNDQLRPLERELLGRAADSSDARVSLPREVEDRLVAMVRDIGLWGIGVPEEFGGVGLSTLGNCLVEEELCKTIVPFDLGDVSPVLFDCTPRQREDYLVPVLDRRRTALIALMEPGKGADIADMSTIYRRENGTYRLNGAKLCFPRLDPAGDCFAVVFAAGMGEGAAAGPSCFLVDSGTPGLSVGQGGQRVGWRTQLREPVSVVLQDCCVTPDSLLGQEGGAFHLGRKWLPSRRLVRGARAVGVAGRLLEEAATQAQSWQSFGQLICGRTSVEAALADIAVGVHACRLMVYEAASKADEGQPVKREAAMVKLFATQMIRSAADRVAHVFGGPPHLAGLPMERMCCHALATSATDLALELQRHIIAADILKGLTV